MLGSNCKRKFKSIDVQSSPLTCAGGPLPYAGESLALSVRGVKGIFLPFLGWVRKWG